MASTREGTIRLRKTLGKPLTPHFVVKRRHMGDAGQRWATSLVFFVAAHEPSVDDLVGGELFGVIERFEISHAVAALKRSRDEPIGHTGILRQKRSVNVGAKDVLFNTALKAALAIVTMAKNHASERLYPRSERCASSVILVAHNRLR